MFLRLRHTEYGKTFSSYVSEYKEADDYFHINFDLNDPVSYIKNNNNNQFLELN